MSKFAIGPDDLPTGSLTKGLKAAFMKAYGSFDGQTEWRDVATVIPSDSDSEDYSWIGAVPKIREWIGPRALADLSAFNYNVKNKLYESSIGVKRTDLEDGKLGMVKFRIQQMAEAAANGPGELLWAWLVGALGSAAAPYLCYDGQGFFDTDHTAPEGESSNQANKVTVALTSANLWLGIAAMMMFKDDRGRLLGVVPDTLAVEPCLAELAIKLCKSDFHADAATANVGSSYNSLKDFNLKAKVVPELYSTATVANANWMLLCTKKAIKPVIWQERSKVEFGAQEAESKDGFMLDEYAYGTRQRGNVGAGPWFLAYGSSGAA